MHTCNTITQDTEAECQVQDQPGVHGRTLSKKKKKKATTLYFRGGLQG
jgi:hypothetical protein